METEPENKGKVRCGYVTFTEVVFETRLSKHKQGQYVAHVSGLAGGTASQLRTWTLQSNEIEIRF